MKKLLLSTVVLFLFSASILIFQASCKKEANAQQSGNEQSSVILYKIADESLPNNVTSAEYWVVDINGQNKRKIPINLPTNLVLHSGSNGHLVNGGKTLIFTVTDKEETQDDPRIYYIYSCALDGSNLKKVIDYTSTNKGYVFLELQGAY
ncbi:hypothetical protein [Pedobacter glucosidilyticus]|uniref:hypothetical protein n=1 Tax=Pedobacter glucosidilyticus TaxID=1122941 RepID=UPI0026EA9A17|nr:hypothetical protein [Pedobacter glucosidilyticus]